MRNPSNFFLEMSKILGDRGCRWILFGWTFFITENIVLSEYKTTLTTPHRSKANDMSHDNDQPPRYHPEESPPLLSLSSYKTLYATLSLLSCSSILYGYARYGVNKGPTIASNLTPLLLRMPLQYLGLVGLFYSYPSKYNPVLQKDHNHESLDSSATRHYVQSKINVSRHPQLMSLSTLALSTALSSKFYTTRLLTIPLPLFALVGGYHQDVRARRDGRLKDDKEEKSTLVPFGAYVMGYRDPLEILEWVQREREGLFGIGALCLGLVVCRRAVRGYF
jgi:uncharacterized membrane protein